MYEGHDCGAPEEDQAGDRGLRGHKVRNQHNQRLHSSYRRKDIQGDRGRDIPLGRISLFLFFLNYRECSETREQVILTIPC